MSLSAHLAKTILVLQTDITMYYQTRRYFLHYLLKLRAINKIITVQLTVLHSSTHISFMYMRVGQEQSLKRVSTRIAYQHKQLIVSRGLLKKQTPTIFNGYPTD